ncbi:Nectin-3-like protein [Triplophysa tibetana]|uniref:Nectin-3-like protein n=1 Tax=Triplophysa tibetana TaxID=1572043 RepID=A0A5A9MUQ8_9TELE|nr:Nectin-3-like protein [Triplophysa tibetana]
MTAEKRFAVNVFHPGKCDNQRLLWKVLTSENCAGEQSRYCDLDDVQVHRVPLRSLQMLMYDVITETGKECVENLLNSPYLTDKQTKRQSPQCGWYWASIPIDTPVFHFADSVRKKQSLWANEVLVPEHVTAVLGKNVTLTCNVRVSTNLSLTQSSWERRLPSGTFTLAVFNPEYGISIADNYSNRVHFLKPSVHDVSIILEGVGFADIGTYTCKVVTFQLGNMQASTKVEIMVMHSGSPLRCFCEAIFSFRGPGVIKICRIQDRHENGAETVEPKVYVSPGSLSLLAGDGETLVATCTAERGRPASDVLWVTDLDGQTDVMIHEETDGTTTTLAHFIWAPTREGFGSALSCIVLHPALSTEYRIPYQLNVLFPPDVVVVGLQEVWYVGQENVKLDCKAAANPPAHVFLWTRLDAPMPAGVDTSNGSLMFTRPLEQNDSGQYRCEVQNDVGRSVQDVRILIIEPPPTTAIPTTQSNLPKSSLTITAPVKQQAHVTFPSEASAPHSSLGTVMGGVIGGILVLVLLTALAGFIYMRQRRTFRGNYYTKQYIGPSDMQKESQSDVLEPNELRDVYGDDSGNGSQELKPKIDGDIIYPDYGSDHKDMEGWSDNLSLQKEETYYSDHHNHHNVNPSGPPLHNGSPYLQDECRNNGTDSDYVSHVDGSVISRREWYV